MTFAPDYEGYARMMRRLAVAGTDLEVDARFVDMLCPRASRILDVGCGIGAAVSGLRGWGHEAYGLDPSEAVLEVAAELYDAQWYRRLGIEEVTSHALQAEGLPERFEAVLMSGNVAALVPSHGVVAAFTTAANLLVPGGFLVVGTTTAVRGGPVDQDEAAERASLALLARFSDWHLGRFGDESPWSVSVFTNAGELPAAHGPDGIFLLA